jgi:hypothetical protein
MTLDVIRIGDDTGKSEVAFETINESALAGDAYDAAS